MNETEKLPVLIHHWIEHNESHREEFDKWAGRAQELGLDEVAKAIRQAAADLEKASAALRRAQESLGSKGSH